jgi:MFS family permease
VTGLGWWRARRWDAAAMTVALVAPVAVLVAFATAEVVKEAVGEARPCRSMRHAFIVEACPAPGRDALGGFIEGARSITGPFLGTLGASAAVVAAVAGFGELLGYALRSVVGFVADRTGRYWPITLFGYLVQMAAVPALALAGDWQIAAVLIAAERSGRAIRNPARDAILAHATGELGRGWVFGVREALDAAGAMVGPLVVAAVLYSGHGYRAAFAVLLVPALLTVVVLLGAWRQYPHPADLEVDEGIPDRRGIPRVFWIYLLAMGLIALGYADYPLIAFHFGAAHVISGGWIPVLYAGAMATEAVAALILGRLFDRIGLLTVVGATVLTAAFAPLVFLGNATLAVIGVICRGRVRGAAACRAGPDPAGDRRVGTARPQRQCGCGEVRARARGSAPCGTDQYGLPRHTLAVGCPPRLGRRRTRPPGTAAQRPAR